MFDSNHVQNDFIYQTGGSIPSSRRPWCGAMSTSDAERRKNESTSPALDVAVVTPSRTLGLGRWWGGGNESTVRSWWALNTTVLFSLSWSSRHRATTAAPCSRRRWRVSSTDHPFSDGSFLHERRWLPHQLVGVHTIPLLSSIF
jgi:hypothetical protein